MTTFNNDYSVSDISVLNNMDYSRGTVHNACCGFLVKGTQQRQTHIFEWAEDSLW